jgi:hypothetical protein
MARNFSKRRYGVRREKKVVYIYSEGEVTEPMYFGSLKKELRLSEVHVVPLGTGFATLKLVQFAMGEIATKEGDYESWVVFDKDDHKGFNEAVDTATANGIGVAYSNECFELWYILHFEYLQTALGRKNLFGSKLSNSLGVKYEKNMDVFPYLKDLIGTAIRNAKKLETMHTKDGISSCEKRTPSTTVYKLVERLIELS